MLSSTTVAALVPVFEQSLNKICFVLVLSANGRSRWCISQLHLTIMEYLTQATLLGSKERFALAYGSRGSRQRLGSSIGLGFWWGWHIMAGICIEMHSRQKAEKLQSLSRVGHQWLKDLPLGPTIKVHIISLYHHSGDQIFTCGLHIQTRAII
jgi:hypothetical protein